MLKKCSKCQGNKRLEEFSKDKSKKDGFTSACRDCNNERDKKRRENGGDFSKNQKQAILKKYSSFCQICKSTSNVQVDHKLAQYVCRPNTASIEENGWVLCKVCNVAKGTRILLEVIQLIPQTVLGPMLLKEIANVIGQGGFEKVPFTISGMQFTEVKFK